MPDRLLNLREVMHTVGLGRSAIYAAIKAGTFPKQRKASAAKVMWLESEIQAWIAALPVAEGRSDEEPAHTPAWLHPERAQ